MARSRQRQPSKKVPPRPENFTFPGWLSPLLLIIAGLIVFANSFQGVFLYDDIVILNEPRLHHLRPIMDVVGQTNRPLLNLSLALNYALGQTNVLGYHAFNLAVHIGAALALYGILRRTLALPRVRQVWMGNVEATAFVISLLWLIHPLQTASVTYIIQRAESMMGLFFLLTVYSSIRYFENNKNVVWVLGAIVSCLMALSIKEVAVTLPVVIVAYDRMFFAVSWKEIFKRRWGMYLGLVLTWGWSVFLLDQTDFHKQSAGFQIKGIHWPEYLLTQPAVVLHYLKLAFIPTGLCLDYLWQPAKSVGEVGAGLIVLGSLALGTMYALRKNSPAGFLGIWFFVILSVTSSFFPLADLAFEHRMYLPLAAVVTFVVFFVNQFLKTAVRQPLLRRQIHVGVTIGAFVVLSTLTVLRNQDYQSEIGMLKDVIQKRPQNVRAMNDLGLKLVKERNFREGRSYLLKANEMFRDNPATYNSLGLSEYYQGHYQQAADYFHKAVSLEGVYDEALMNLGLTYASMGRTEEAESLYRQALAIDPNFAEANNNLGSLFLDQGKWDEAIGYCLRAIKMKPHYEAPYNNIGAASILKGDFERAEEFLKKAIQLNPQYAKALNNLGVVYKARGQLSRAEKLFREALLIDPGYKQAGENLREILSRNK